MGDAFQRCPGMSLAFQSVPRSRGDEGRHLNKGLLNLVPDPSLDMPSFRLGQPAFANNSKALTPPAFGREHVHIRLCVCVDRWRLRTQGGASQVQHVLSANCIDAGSEHKPILQLGCPVTFGTHLNYVR